MRQLTAFLAQHHDHLVRHLEIARHAAQRERWAVCRHHFAQFRQALLCHIVADEDSLIPAAATARQANLGGMLMMRIGENEMTTLVVEMQALPGSCKQAAFIQSVDQMLALLKQHKVRERALTSLLADSAPAAVQAQLLEDMEGLLGQAA